jgi:Myb-like DNA-binding domain
MSLTGCRPVDGAMSSGQPKQGHSFSSRRFVNDLSREDDWLGGSTPGPPVFERVSGHTNPFNSYVLTRMTSDPTPDFLDSMLLPYYGLYSTPHEHVSNQLEGPFTPSDHLVMQGQSSSPAMGLDTNIFTISNVAELAAPVWNSDTFLGCSRIALTKQDSDLLMDSPVIQSATANGTERRKFVRWTTEEDALLKTAIEMEHGCTVKAPFKWKKIAQHYFLDRRNEYQCKSRWFKVSSHELLCRLLQHRLLTQYPFPSRHFVLRPSSQVGLQLKTESFWIVEN